MILMPYIKMNTRAGGAIVHAGLGGISDVTSVYIYRCSSRASINDAAKSYWCGFLAVSTLPSITTIDT